MDVFNLFAKLSLDSSEYEKGLGDAEKKAEGLGKSFKTGATSIAKGAGILAGVGVAAYKFADGVSQDLDQIDKMSQKLGMSTDAYQEWDYVLKISGTEMSSMSTGLKTLTNKFDDAVNGSEGAIETFEKLGLSMEDIQGMSREDLFGTVITAFQGMEDSAERAALANDLFGKSGQELAPLFNTTTEETQALIQQVNDLGGVISEDAVKNGAAFQDSLTGLQAAFASTASKLTSELIPAITTLVNKFADFVSNGGLTKLVSTLKILAPAIVTVVSAIAGFKVISGTITMIKDLKTAFTLLNTVVSGSPLIGFLSTLGSVAAGVAAFFAGAEIGKKLGGWLFPDDAELYAHYEGIVGTFEMLKDFFIALGDFFVMLWEDISAGFTEKWEEIKAKAGEVWEGIKAVFEGAGEWFGEKWNAIKEKVSQAWEDMKTKASEAWEGIKSVFGSVGEWFSEKWQSIKDAVATKWEEIKQGAADLWQSIQDKFEGVGDWFAEKWQAAKDAVVSAWDGIKEFFAQLWEDIKDAFNLDEALEWGRDMIDNFIGGIKEKWSDIKQCLKDLAQLVADFLGFSEPKKGPLSNFHTYAPDMMQLFAKGIRDNEKLVTDEFNGIEFDPTVKDGVLNLGAGSPSLAMTSGSGQGNTTVILELDKVELGKVVYNLNNSENQRMGVKLAGGVL